MSIQYTLLDNQRDALLLAARVLILILFAYFGTTYVFDHSSFVKYLQSVNAPTPRVTAIIGTVVEFFGTIVLLIGFWTRPVAVFFAVYTLGTAVIGHAFWNITTPAEHHAQFVHFLKNISIAAGFLFLALAGPGRFSLDRR